MSPQLHVLLIGIDAYDVGAKLTGCVNDIDALQRFLIDRVGVTPDRITRLAAPRSGATHQTDVPQQVPTLDNLRTALKRLGDPEVVSPGDRVLVCYSGHGTQCLVEDARGFRFTREALLPKDNQRGTERRFLFDWELNELIADVAACQAAVTVILDSCSSGGATRGELGEPTAADRFVETEGVYRLHADEAVIGVRGVRAGLGGVQQCQVIAACRDDERARESSGDDARVHGELTRALLRQLERIPDQELGDLRWGRIWRAVDADVRQQNRRQSPLLAGSFGRRIFGFGPDADGDTGYAVVAVPGGFQVDVGTLAGVTGGARIAVYGAAPPSFPPLGSAADLAAREGVLKVTCAQRSTAEAVAVAPFQLPDAARGRLIAAGRAARLRVELERPDAALESALAGSDLIEVVRADAELTLVPRSGSWVLTDDVHGSGAVAGEPVLAAIPPGHLGVARAMVEHYHAYRAPLRLARACCDLPDSLRLWLLDCNRRDVSPAEAQNPDLPQLKAGTRAPYELQPGDRICFVVENRAEVPLSVTLIDCAPSGRVFILGEKRLARGSRHVFWAQETLGRPFVTSLAASQPIGVDRLVAIGTTRPDVSMRHLARATGFADVLYPRAITRGGSSHRDSEPPAEQWTAATTSLRIAART